MSSGFTHRFLPIPRDVLPPEFVYVPDALIPTTRDIELELAISEWNNVWESGHLRREMFQAKKSFKDTRWLRRFKKHNVYLLRYGREYRYDVYSPLYHLLPLKT